MLRPLEVPMSRRSPLGLALSCPLALSLALASTAEAAPLPTFGPPGDPDAGWRDGLRSYVVSMQDPADFDLTVGGLLPGFAEPGALYGGTTNGSFTPAAQLDIERAWLLDKGTTPHTSMLRIPPECFTGDYIEGNVTVPDHGLPTSDSVFVPTSVVGTSGYGFLWAWEYGASVPSGAPQGNPYYQMPQLLNRAAVRLAVELIMVDQMHKTQDNDDPGNYILASADTNPGGWPQHAIDLGDWEASPSGQWHPPECVPYGCGFDQTLNRSQYLALTLFDLASEYAFTRSGLPDWLKASFDAAFLRLGNRLAAWGPAAGQMNFTTPGANALYLIAALTGEPQAMTDYEDYTMAMLAPPLFDEAGFFRDDGGWDASYNNYNLDHLGRLVRHELEYGPSGVHGDVTTALESMYWLKSHLTVVDPDGEWGFRYSPNHWNSRTAQGVVHAQGTKSASAFDGIVLDIDGAYADLQGADPLDHEGFGWAMSSTYLQTNKETGNKHVDLLDDGVNAVWPANDYDWNPSSTAPYEGVAPWQYIKPGYVRPAWASMIAKPGDHAAWDAALVDPELDLYPVQRSGDGIEIIDDDFVWARFGAMTAMIHTGRVSSYEGPAKANPDISRLPAGYGGGMLSYLYGDQAGAGVIGRRRARYGSNPELMDDWSQWWRWSLHDVWLHNDQGGLTQSGRILQPSVSVTPIYSGLTPQSVVVEVSGNIPVDNQRFGTVLSQPVPYSRVFTVDQGGLRVETSVAACADPLFDAVETIPLNGIGYRYQGYHMLAGQGVWEDDLSVVFTDANGDDHPIYGPNGVDDDVEQYKDDIVLVTYQRLGGEVVVEFTTPQRVKLSSPYAHWDRYYGGTVDDDGVISQSLLRTRNLVVDLIGNADDGTPGWLVDTTVEYTIYTY